jgi:hypothetical protein
VPKHQDEVIKLNKEIETLKNQLLMQQMQTENYNSSMSRAQSIAAGKPLSKDINPILKQIRNKNMTMREKGEILFPDLYPSDPEDIFYQWVAPSRITIKRDKQWYWTVALVIMFIVFFAVFANQFMLVAVALAFLFAIYVSNSVPAADTIYKLTRQGIEIGEGEGIEVYSWAQLIEYSYYYKSGTEVLYIDTILAVPQRLQLLFTQEDRKNINMIMESNLPYKPPPRKQGRIARFIDGIYIPLHEFKALQEKIDKYYDHKYAEIIADLKKEGRIPQDITVQDIRKAESITNLKLMDQIQKQQEDEAKQILGLN